MIVKVKDNPDFVYDNASGSLLNTNTAAIEAYRGERSRIASLHKMNKRLLKLETLVTKMQSDIDHLVKTYGNR